MKLISSSLIKMRYGTLGVKMVTIDDKQELREILCEIQTGLKNLNNTITEICSKVNAKTYSGEKTVLSTIIDVIKDHPDGIGTHSIMQITGFSRKKVSNHIEIAKRNKIVTTVQRGIYVYNEKK